MDKKICKVCKKGFLRQWNLKRHLKDIHKIHEYRENDMVKQKSEAYSYPFSNKNEDFRNPENNMSEMNYYQNPPEYHNFTNPFSNYDIHNSRIYENVESIPIDKESRLTIKDLIKIQRAFQILRNYFQQFYPQLPNVIITNQMRWLYYRCYTKQSLQPLMDYYKRYNIWHLWPLY